MEADWEFEIAPQANPAADPAANPAADLAAPIIDAAWPRFIDLRAHPRRIAEISEAASFPALARALVQLNSPASPVWTAKCDVWIPGAFDPDELDAPPSQSSHALACYIDLLPSSAHQWPSPALVEAFCRSLCDLLRAIPLRNCRADLIVRRAIVAPSENALAITAYLTACGPSARSAKANLSRALSALSAAITRQISPAE
jgi:hypothetical protein